MGQEALGHMPFPVTTVIHVPLGVTLYWLSAHLTWTSHQVTRPRREGSTDSSPHSV